MKAITGLGLLLAVMPGVAGCRDGGGTAPVPASFSPSPCPPGWHETSDGGCLITGTLKPGQDLPLPAFSGTPLPMPVHLPSPDGTPGAALDAYARPAS